MLDTELLDLPALVRQLAEAQVRTEQRQEQLVAQIGRLTSGVDQLTEQVAALTTQTQRLANDVGSLKGELLELRVRARAAAYFGHLARRLRVLEDTLLADLLDDAVDEGRLSFEDRVEILQADAVLSGRRREDRAEVYLVVEISVGVGLSDVQYATRRAALLAKLGRSVMPVVAGQYSSPEADEYARRSGVWQVLAGRHVAPEAS